GIVLKQVTPEGEYYEGEADQVEGEAEAGGSSTAGPSPAALAAALPTAAEAPWDVGQLLPAAGTGSG
ncbi:MAG: hypothetical protein GTO03_07410, partial [Planctomycetales bacterium]|nr:hypothetical protein [Planctomycetales bacterium]